MSASDRTTANEVAELQYNSHLCRDEDLTEGEILDKAMDMLEGWVDQMHSYEIMDLFLRQYPDLSAHDIALKLYQDEAIQRLRDEQNSQWDNN